MLEWILAILLIAVVLVIAVLMYFSWRTGRKVEQTIPPIGKYVEVDGAKLHYVDRGEGPPVVMIHGLGGNLYHYNATILDEIAKTNRVIAFDRPGAGYSERPAGADATTGTQAAIIQKALDKLGIGDPLIVGHSLGGAISLAHAVLHPGKARGYVLIAPAASPNQTMPPMFKPLAVPSPIMQKIVAWTIGVPMGIKRGAEITAAVFAPQKPPADYATASGGLLSLRPKAIETNMKDFVASRVTTAQISANYDQIKVPVICVYGLSDKVLDPELHLAALSTIPDIEIDRIDGAGHMLLHGEPDALIAAIQKLDGKTSADSQVAAE